MTDNAYLDSFQKLLDTVCPPGVVRAIEAGGQSDLLWTGLNDSGFVDALVAESAGGSGLRLEDVFPWLVLCGSSALPQPLAFTMYARAALADDGQQDVPSGPITLATGLGDSAGGLRCHAVPWGFVSDWVLVESADACMLLPTADAARERAGTAGSLAANLHWPSVANGRALTSTQELRSVGAALLCAHMAGAMLELLDRSVSYANEREQFGKPIGRFQAIQQQLSVMAEQVFAAHMSAEIGCRGGWQSRGYRPAPLHAAVAKARCSDAVVRIATTAHAVHGAIGITQDFDLQLLTRRLHEWRMAYGGEIYWQRQLGSVLLSQSVSSPDFIRQHIAATATL